MSQGRRGGRFGDLLVGILQHYLYVNGTRKGSTHIPKIVFGLVDVIWSFALVLVCFDHTFVTVLAIGVVVLKAVGRRTMYVCFSAKPDYSDEYSIDSTRVTYVVREYSTYEYLYIRVLY